MKPFYTDGKEARYNVSIKLFHYINKMYKDVTIVISPKENYRIADQIDRVLRALPDSRIPIYYIISRPLPKSYENHLQDIANSHENVKLFEFGIDSWLPNGFKLRNLIIPHITTKYAFYIYNDVLPLNKDWLDQMYKVAENNPEYSVFQPVIWEDMKHYHAEWISLALVECGDQRFLEHSFREDVFNILPSSDADAEWKTKIKQGPQPYHLEDHAIFVKTEFIREEPIFVEHTPIKEFLNMILYLRKRGTLPYLVKECHVFYGLPIDVPPEDILFQALKRCDYEGYQSLANFEKVWGVHYPFDGIGQKYILECFQDTCYKLGDIPESQQTQFNMLLGMFIIMGYNQFRCKTDISLKKDLRTFYRKHFVPFPKNESIEIEMQFVTQCDPQLHLPDFSQELYTICPVIQCPLEHDNHEKLEEHKGLYNICIQDFTVRYTTTKADEFTLDSELYLNSHLVFKTQDLIHYYCYVRTPSSEKDSLFDVMIQSNETITLKLDKKWQLLKWDFPRLPSRNWKELFN